MQAKITNNHDQPILKKMKSKTNSEKTRHAIYYSKQDAG
jgi:hypothetical protein